ncbi:hypothetical protein XI03_36920 [Bradyrhizobium sp. CCBAU 65884]|nr:hypothetical protein [Bradyrhizobium sp. CCBAU 65884]
MIQVEQPFDQMILTGVRSPSLDISDGLQLMRILTEVSLGILQNFLDPLVDFLLCFVDRHIGVEMAVKESDAHRIDKSLDLRKSFV